MGANAKKAAQMLVLLGEETAAEIMSHLNEAEIEQVSREISSVGSISAVHSVEDVEEIYQTLMANSFVEEGGVDYASRILQRSMGVGSAKRIVDRLSSSYRPNGLQSIESVNPAQLSQFVQHEHPQTIALILSHLRNATAAELLKSLPEDLQADVSLRMSNVEEISPEVISSIATVLEEKLKPVGSYVGSKGTGGIRAVAEMLNRLDRSNSKAVLEKIGATAPEVSTSIKELMFIFEDISMLDDLAIREILQRIDKKNLAQALKGTVPMLQEHFYRNMSQRAVEMLKEEIELMGPLKAADVHLAQQQIVEVVRQLEDEGTITVGGGGSQYVV